MADLIAAVTARERAVTGATHKDQAQAHQRWMEYLDSIGLAHDPYLDGFTRCQRNLIICAFVTEKSETDDFQVILSKPWLQEQSEIPFQVYARPSGETVDLTHPKTRIFNLVSF